jgi:hypothetical protein
MPLNETIQDVQAVFIEAGYTPIRPNKKTRGYKSRRGRIVYLSLTQTRPPWRVTIDPRLPQDLARSPGVEVLDDYYHGSNMIEFPRRMHTGQKESPYGWRLKVADAAALRPALRRVDDAPIPEPR